LELLKKVASFALEIFLQMKLLYKYLFFTFFLLLGIEKTDINIDTFQFVSHLSDKAPSSENYPKETTLNFQTHLFGSLLPNQNFANNPSRRVSIHPYFLSDIYYLSIILVKSYSYQNTNTEYFYKFSSPVLYLLFANLRL